MPEFPKSEIKKHVFVCTNRPPMKEGSSMVPKKCGYQNADKLRAEAKDLCKSFGKSVRVNTSGCLDRCDEGIVAVIYPEGKWITELTENDAQLLFDEVSKAGPNSDSKG